MLPEILHPVIFPSEYTLVEYHRKHNIPQRIYGDVFLWYRPNSRHVGIYTCNVTTVTFLIYCNDIYWYILKFLVNGTYLWCRILCGSWHNCHHYWNHLCCLQTSSTRAFVKSMCQEHLSYSQKQNVTLYTKYKHLTF
jgi:hypothetical protein